MELEHSFTVPVGVEQAWAVLLDIERVAPCMPGAVLDSVDGDSFTGRVKIKLGPVNLTYKGTASFVKKDADAHRAVIDARGKDARGNGTAAAKVTATLVAQGEDSTEVKVLTDLNITGKPAQFGRGVMVDVGNKLIGQFASCLEGKLSGGDADSGATDDADNGATDETAGAGGDVAAGEPTAGGDGTGQDAKVEAAPAPALPSDDSAAVGTSAPADPPPASAPKPAGGSAPKPAARPAPAAEPEPIDLLELAGGTAIAKIAPVAAGGVLLALIFFLLGRRTAR